MAEICEWLANKERPDGVACGNPARSLTMDDGAGATLLACGIHENRARSLGWMVLELPVVEGIDLKRCSSCATMKPLTEFHRQSGTYDGKHARCKRCHVSLYNEYKKLKHAEGRERTQRQGKVHGPKRPRSSSEGKRHGLSVAEYETLFLSQGGLCAICGRPESRLSVFGVTHRLSIDHNHECCPGARSCGMCVRGLLCHNCNIAIGLMKDDPTVAIAAAAYLQLNAITKSAKV